MVGSEASIFRRDTKIHPSDPSNRTPLGICPAGGGSARTFPPGPSVVTVWQVWVTPLA